MLQRLFVFLSLAFALIVAIEPVQAQSSAFSRGEYQELITQFDCPQDEDVYGTYYEGVYESAVHYCGVNVPAGYWVYQAPQWHIYRQLKQPSLLAQARLGGKYKGLINFLSCPEERAQEEAIYGAFYDYGWETASEYCGQSFPAAYWVWVAPNWYLWRHKDLQAIGFKTQQIRIPLNEPLTIQIEYAQGHRDWARATLQNIQSGIIVLEKWSGIDFPGQRPYLLEERPNFELLGMAGRHKMALASPPRGTPWTLLHEMVHIWNVEVEPLWFNEGQANFIAYLLLKELNLPFYAPETLPEYLRAWEAIKGTEADLPLQGNYTKLPQGKAMAFWKMLYELGGPDLIQESFQQSVNQGKISLDDLRLLLHKYTDIAPDKLLSGWVLPGKYQLDQASDLGAVKYPLP